MDEAKICVLEDRSKKTVPIPSPTRLAVCFTFYIIGVFGLGTLTATLIMKAASTGDGFWANLIPEGKLYKVQGRCLMLWCFLLLPKLVKQMGWGGLSDLGFWPGRGEKAMFSPNRAVHCGLLIGLLSIGPIMLLAGLTGYRQMTNDMEPTGLIWSGVAIAFTAITVSLIEEVVSRGILFRCLARIWTVWPAALFISLFFSVGHFLGPNRYFVFESGPYWSNVISVFKATFTPFASDPFIGLRMLNIVLMSCVLCLFVQRTKTIWLAIGTHAAWVWLIQMNQIVTQGVSWADRNPWFGKKNDATDSWLACIALSAMLIFVSIKRSPKAS